MDINGNWKWVKAITNDEGGTNQITSITTDQSNNIYIGGTETNTGYIDGQVRIPATANTESFIIKTDDQ